MASSKTSSVARLGAISHCNLNLIDNTHASVVRPQTTMANSCLTRMPPVVVTGCLGANSCTTNDTCLSRAGSTKPRTCQQARNDSSEGATQPGASYLLYLLQSHQRTDPRWQPRLRPPEIASRQPRQLLQRLRYLCSPETSIRATAEGHDNKNMGSYRKAPKLRHLVNATR